MNLSQLKCIKAVIDNDLNVTMAAQQLYMTQPAVSKKIAQLEAELGLKIFERKGRHFSNVTAIGQQILDEACVMLEVEQRLKARAKDHTDPESGSMNVFTTNTIARFILPQAIMAFTKKYPKVPFHVGSAEPSKYGLPNQYGSSDFYILAQQVDPHKNLIVLPAYLWSLSLILPKDHPLTREKELTLAKIAQYKIISYEQGSTGRDAQDKAFNAAGLTPHYLMTLMDADVIKKYVQLGLGVGIIASIAANNLCDDEVVSLPLSGLIDACPAWLCFSRSVYLQKHMYDFIESFAPHLTKSVMETIHDLSSQKIQELCSDFKLRVY